MIVKFRFLRDQADWAWINRYLPLLRVEDSTGIMAVDVERNRIVGACVMDNWTVNSIQAHLVAATPLVFRHHFIEFLGDYLFAQCGLKYVYASVLSTNQKSLKTNIHMGYKTITTLPNAWCDGVDYILMVLTPQTCWGYPPKEGLLDGKKF